MRVLLVEDQRAFATALKDRMLAYGCEVILVTNAQDCFEAATGDPPHMILVSSKLGPMSGLNICNGLRRDPKLRKIPLVIMASEPLAELAGHMALTTRADAYIGKDADAVMAQVSSAMEARWDRGALVGRRPPPSTQRTGSGAPRSVSGYGLPETPTIEPNQPEARSLVELVLTTPNDEGNDVIELITQESVSVPAPAASATGDEPRPFADLQAELTLERAHKQEALERVEALETDRRRLLERIERLEAHDDD